jgi:hypothetical protein
VTLMKVNGKSKQKNFFSPRWAFGDISISDLSHGDRHGVVLTSARTARESLGIWQLCFGEYDYVETDTLRQECVHLFIHFRSRNYFDRWRDRATLLLNWKGWSFFAEMMIHGRRRKTVISREENDRFGSSWVFRDQRFENYLMPLWSTDDIFRVMLATNFFTEASVNRSLHIADEELRWFYKPEKGSWLDLIALW